VLDVYTFPEDSSLQECDVWREKHSTRIVTFLMHLKAFPTIKMNNNCYYVRTVSMCITSSWLMFSEHGSYSMVIYDMFYPTTNLNADVSTQLINGSLNAP
jgi:hypothetical protein